MLRLLFLVLLCSPLVASAVIGEMTVNGGSIRDMNPLAPSMWRFRFFDSKTLKLITNYRQGHGKYMHIVVVKEDLSTFAHIHPRLVKDKGSFLILVNSEDDLKEQRDPDNFQIKRVVTEPGRYYIFTEVFPDRGPISVRAEIANFELEAKGGVKTNPVLAERTNANGEYIKYFSENDEIESYGAPYQVKLRVETTHGCLANLIRFHIDYMAWDKDSGTYIAAKIEPWLQRAGHGIVVGLNGNSSNEKLFSHTHAMKHPKNETLVYNIFDRKKIGQQTLKLWTQIKHNNKVRTFPFVFKYIPEYIDCK